MNSALVDRIVAATLYEGYILYPYRPTSVKNQVRWTFGGVFPRAYTERAGDMERSSLTTECLVQDLDHAAITVRARFLHPVTRTVLQLREPVAELCEADVAGADPVAALDVGGARHVSWEEASERCVAAGTFTIEDLVRERHSTAAGFPAYTQLENLRDERHQIAGVVRRTWQQVDVGLEVRAERCTERVYRVAARLSNETATADRDRNSALLHALVSAHLVLTVSGGRWLSCADPPDEMRGHAAACFNNGLWPAVVADGGVDDTVLASPIILDDHPQVAPESAGDLFDATEIDEILSLRILTLTDDEKHEMRAADARARALLDRTEALTEAQFMRMHGTIRDVRRATGEKP